jgi:hypothetical protein
MSLTETVKQIASSYGDIRAMAMAAAVSPKEVAAALSKAKPDTVEFVVLSLLAEFHPVAAAPAAPPAPEE